MIEQAAEEKKRKKDKKGKWKSNNNKYSLGAKWEIKIVFLWLMEWCHK